MSKNSTIVPLILLLLLTWIISAWLQQKYCCNATGDVTNAGAVVPAVSEDNPYCSPWELSDGADFHQSAKYYLWFLRGQSDVLDYGSERATLLSNVVEYLNANNEQKIIISGIYDEEEAYSGEYSNVGEARAESVKQLLTDQGVDFEQIITESDFAESTGFIGDTLCRGVEMYFAEEPEPEEVTEESIGEDLEADGLVLYFDFASDDANFSSGDREVLDALIAYLNSHPEARIQITGHTDNVGAPDKNKAFSRQRARKIRTYLTSRSVSRSRITIEGMGEEQPIADNDSEEGRRQNRRVEVQLIK